MAPLTHHHTTRDRNIYLIIILQFILWIGISIFLIFTQTAYQVSEAREGVVIEEIINSNTWILPLRHGEIIPSKPPLFHWISASFSILCGTLNEFTLRLPSLLGGLAIVLVSFLFCKKHLGYNVSVISLSFLLTSYCLIQMGIDGRVDMLFCAFLLAALFYFLDIFLSKDEVSDKDKLIIGTYLGLSVLTKGPLGIVLYIVGSFPLLLFKFKIDAISISNLKKWYLNIGLIPMLLISMPWYVLAYIYGSDGFVSRQLIFENIARFLGHSGIPSKPFWFYLFHLFSQATVSVLALLALSYNYIASTNKPTKLKPRKAEAVKLLALQAFSILLFLSLASGKRRAYLLPIMPHIAIIAGILLENYGTHKLLKYVSYLDPIPKLILGFVLVLQLFKIMLPMFGSSKNFLLIGLGDLPPATSVGLLLIGTFLLVLINRIRSKFNSTNENHTPMLSLYFTSFYFLIFLLLPAQFFLAKGYSHSYYQFAKELKDINISDEKITFIKNKKDESFDTLFFYYKKRIYLHDLTTPSEPGFYLARLEWLSNQSDEFKQRCTKILNGGREKDPENRNLILFKLN